MWQSPPAPPQTLVEVFARMRDGLLGALPHLIMGACVFVVFWLVARIGQAVIAYAAPRVRADTGVVLLLSRVYYYGVLVFGLVTALGASGLDVTALVTGLGLTGFALGFALKDVLSNFLSGIMLLLYRPFNIGDRIRMGEFEGTIQTIRIRDTLVHAADGRLIIIPNTKLITEVVVNYNAAPWSAGPPATPHAHDDAAAEPEE
jgi:small conductance mechanosensitive channel